MAIAKVYVDPREGSKRFIDTLLIPGVKVEKRILPYGDLAFTGYGREDREVKVGVEYKTVKDVVNCMSTGRFTGHQLPGMASTYDVPWLLVEGEWWTGLMGDMLVQSSSGPWKVKAKVGSRRLMAVEYSGWLMSVMMRSPCMVWSTRDFQESLVWLAGLVRWWVGYMRADGVWIEKGWERHKSHVAPYRSNGYRGVGYVPEEYDICRDWAARLPGVGVEKSREVSRHFKSALNMSAAGVKEWVEVPGIGAKMAARIVAGIRKKRK